MPPPTAASENRRGANRTAAATCPAAVGRPAPREENSNTLGASWENDMGIRVPLGVALIFAATAMGKPVRTPLRDPDLAITFGASLTRVL